MARCFLVHRWMIFQTKFVIKDLFFQNDDIDLRAGEKTQRQDGGADAVGNDNGSAGFFIDAFFIAVFVAVDQP